MFDQENLYQNLSTIFGIPIEMVNNKMTMENSECWDSLKHMALITMVEDKYNLTLSMDEIVEMTSIEAISKVLDKKIH
jgi:acyl carrier protein